MTPSPVISPAPLLLTFGEHGDLPKKLSTLLACDSGELLWRHFPDGESYVRVLADVKGRHILLLCSLHDPDRKLLPLLFLTRSLRELGAAKITLVAPYLSYMRQDAVFNPGEIVSARAQAHLLSGHVDALFTIDPHLHRYAAMSELFSIPAHALSAMPLLADYVGRQWPDAILIGPDGESEQWVSACAAQAKVPYQILHKKRHGDREVEISLPDMRAFMTRTPVLLDDMISTGQTLLATIAHLQKACTSAPVCLCVHGVFADKADEKLRAAGVAQIISCNTIPHVSNAIDVAELLAQALLC